MVLPSKVLKTSKWRVPRLSGLHHLLGKFFPDVEHELSKPQPVSISPWCITCCYREEFVTIVTTVLSGCYQIVLYLPLFQPSFYNLCSSAIRSRPLSWTFSLMTCPLLGQVSPARVFRLRGLWWRSFWPTAIVFPN